MRPLALALGTALALAAPLAGTSHALIGCTTVDVPPTFDAKAGAITASGTFACTSPATGMSVTVCVEEDLGGVLGDNWWSDGCMPSDPVNGETQTVSARVFTRVPLYGTLLRTHVTATNDRGDSADSYSVPAPWVNCACMP